MPPFSSTCAAPDTFVSLLVVRLTVLERTQLLELVDPEMFSAAATAVPGVRRAKAVTVASKAAQRLGRDQNVMTLPHEIFYRNGSLCRVAHPR